ncbi:histone deacetylase [Aspergillus sp. HF37]|nr:histone deacetylase [Aspergillus sp. HF37]
MDPPNNPLPSTPNPNPPDDPRSSNLNRLSVGSIASVSPNSPAGPSSSLLSPSEPPRVAQQQARRTPSSSSLRDERNSTPRLQKRSSTASLRSAHNSGGSASPRPSLTRRRSSNFATSPTMTPKTPSLTPVTDIPAPTAASIAAAHFQRELDLHRSDHLQSRTVVIVHDSCYGHRFSRPRASRAALSSIVERPERIRAGVLGLSAAYVRLGRRYAGERFAPHPDLDVHLLPVPPFQIHKTTRSMALSDPAVTHVHGNKWMDDLKNMCDAAESRLAVNGKELVRPPSAGKGEPKAAPLHEGDLYLCSESLNAFEGSLGGVCEGVDTVFGASPTNRAFVCIRPPGHHCSAGHPSGFCWINNVHVGISYAAMTHGLTHAAILDFDLHHGDGSQDIAWKQNSKASTTPRNAANYKKTRVGYFSVHDVNSYPCEMGDPEKVCNASICIDKAHGQSIWNVHLEPWKTSPEFWELYVNRYMVLIEKARAFLRHHTERLVSNPNGPPPKAAIFISAGFDASEWEGVGMQRHEANVPTDFYAKFTADVVQMASEEGLGVDGRVISVLEGGYSDRALTSGIFSHLAGFSDATTAVESPGDQQIDRLSSEMTDRLGLSEVSTTRYPEARVHFDSDWWSPNFLEELEALVYPAAPATKPSEKSGPTYSAPTQSFAAKVVATKDRRSTGSQAESEPAPLPEVGWATAAHELFKILVPSDRQTASYRPTELNAETSRARRDRQTTLDGTSAGAEENRMKLRVRKPKSPLPNTPKLETPQQPPFKGNRRTTIGPGDLSQSQGKSGMRGDRRKSTPVSDAGDIDNNADQDCGQPIPIVGGSAKDYQATPKRSTSPRKAPPVPRVPSTFSSSESRGQADADGDEMDSLAAGVRKLNIKLKVPSPEEHAAREAKATEQRKATKGTRSPKKAAKPRRPQLGGRTSSAPSSHPAGDMETPSTIPSISSQPPHSATDDQAGRVERAQVSDMMSPPITPGFSDASGAHTLYSPSKTAVEDKHRLPVFTSTSAIPFAEPRQNDTPTDKGNPGGSGAQEAE